MPTYAEMDNVRLAALKEELEREYGEIKARGFPGVWCIGLYII